MSKSGSSYLISSRKIRHHPSFLSTSSPRFFSARRNQAVAEPSAVVSPYFAHLRRPFNTAEALTNALSLFYTHIQRWNVVSDLHLFDVWRSASIGSPTGYRCGLAAMNVLYNFGHPFTHTQVTDRLLAFAMLHNQMAEAQKAVKLFKHWLPYPPKSATIEALLDHLVAHGEVKKARHLLAAVRSNWQLSLRGSLYDKTIRSLLRLPSPSGVAEAAVVYADAHRMRVELPASLHAHFLDAVLEELEKLNEPAELVTESLQLAEIGKGDAANEADEETSSAKQEEWKANNEVKGNKPIKNDQTVQKRIVAHYNLTSAIKYRMLSEYGSYPYAGSSRSLTSSCLLTLAWMRLVVPDRIWTNDQSALGDDAAVLQRAHWVELCTRAAAVEADQQRLGELRWSISSIPYGFLRRLNRMADEDDSQAVKMRALLCFAFVMREA